MYFPTAWSMVDELLVFCWKTDWYFVVYFRSFGLMADFGYVYLYIIMIVCNTNYTHICLIDILPSKKATRTLEVNTHLTGDFHPKVVADVCFDATGTLVATGSVDYTAKARRNVVKRVGRMGQGRSFLEDFFGLGKLWC